MENNPPRLRSVGGSATSFHLVAPSPSDPVRPAALPADRSDVVTILLEERETHAAVLVDRDRLLAVFSHDLKNLMNVLLLNGNVPSPTAPDDIAPQVLARMDRLVSNLLDLTRVNAGKLYVVPVPSSTVAVVQEAVKIFRPLAAQKGLTVELSFSDEELDANLDHDRIFQVLSNLLTNAIKFTPSQGRISLRVARTGNLVQVSVRDTGSGIEPEDLERVFEVYRQMDESHVEGLGLGLFIARSIIETHGGRIWVTSRPGLGSTFFFTLTALDATAPQ